MKRTLKFAVMTLLLSFGSAAAYADTVDFSLVNSTQYISSPGGTLTFTATVSAPSSNSGDEFLNSDSFNVDVPVAFDDSDFFANFPLTLSPGASFTGDLFTLTVPAGTAPGAYHGTFTLLGGADGGALGELGTVTYSVTVTPEPSSFMLLGSGLAGTLAVLRRRRFGNV